QNLTGIPKRHSFSLARAGVRPYSVRERFMPYFISKACTKCGACITECPTGSIIEGKEKFLIDADTCAEHAACVAVCPVDAIQLIQKPGSSQKRTEDPAQGNRGSG